MNTIYKIWLCIAGLLIVSTSCLTSCQTPKEGTQKTVTAEVVSVLPDVRGSKQLFALSGLHDTVSLYEPFTAIVLADKLGMRTGNNDHYLSNLTPRQYLKSRPLWISLITQNDTVYNLNLNDKNTFDSLHADIISSNVINTTAYYKAYKISLKMVFKDRKTILGIIEIANKQPDLKDNGQLIINHIHDDSVVTLSRAIILKQKKNTLKFTSLVDSDAFSEGKLIYNLTGKENLKIPFTWQIDYQNTPKDLSFDETDFDTYYDKYINEYKNISLKKLHNEVDNPDLDKTYLKAYSVMMANTLSPIAGIKGLWTTPDRTPHKYMYLWDSGFHGVGLKYVSKEWAQEALLALFDLQMPDGQILGSYPLPLDSSKTKNANSQPPVLAWAVWDIYAYHKDKSFIEKSYEPLKKYIKWFEINRDKNQNGLYEWKNGDESGMDNSPRFDEEELFDAVDLNAFMVSEYENLAQMATVLALPEEQQQFAAKAAKLKDLVNSHLWHADKLKYADRYFNSVFLETEAISDFTPLFAGIASPEQADLLVNKLKDTAT